MSAGTTIKDNIIILTKEKKEYPENPSWNQYKHTFGPYISLTKGKYSIKLKGENLDRLFIEVYNNNNKANTEETIRPEIERVVNTSNECIFNFDIPKDIDGVEFTFWNKTLDEVNPVDIKIENNVYLRKINKNII